LVGGLAYVFLRTTRDEVLQSADILRAQAAGRVAYRVDGELGQAQTSLENVERALRFGVVDPGRPEELERVLFRELIDNGKLAEVAFTHATKLGFDGDGNLRTELADRSTVSVYRPSADASAPVLTRRVTLAGNSFISEVRERPAGGGLSEGTWRRDNEAAGDPTSDLTFETTTSEPVYGELIWSDLHWAELDARLPEAQRRVLVSAQKAVEDGRGHFAGVVRVGLLAQTLDQVSAMKVNESDPADPHRVFLCDDAGRLVTRLSSSDRRVVLDDDLRVEPASLPAPIAGALASPTIHHGPGSSATRSGSIFVGGEPWLVTFRDLTHSRQWMIGIVVPEGYYTSSFERMRVRFGAAFLGLTFGIVVVGVLVVRAVRKGLGRMADATAKMRRFDFAPAPQRTAFRDVQEVMDGLERAKTVVRAMGKYVPLDLVRQLYESNREPTLGGEPRELTLMFTDIRDFTELSERLPPDELARALGEYLETMTGAIAGAGGTIDKFIGDGIMAMWNAPVASEHHEQAACRAALACIEATKNLYGSRAWTGLPPLFTRFGVHAGTVLVGHFGAPSHLSYTALGDAVNLASRLEGLCKIYGVAILVSEVVQSRAKDAFAFRLVDRVAVKGKTKAVAVYELLGPLGVESAKSSWAQAYEQAFDAYTRRAFDDALAVVENQLDDGPSKVLAERCRLLRNRPPPDDWDGVYHAQTK